MKVLGWFFRIIGVVVFLVFLLGMGVYARGRSMSDRVIERPLPSIAAANDSVSMNRGMHMARVMCASCHSQGGQLPMSGSVDNFIGTADGRGPGILYGPNLTPGGLLKSLTDGQIARAVREGIGAANTPLLVMPSRNFHAMADSDLADLLGYMRSQPAVERTLPPKKINVLGYLILGAGQFPLSDRPAITGAVGAPAESPSRQYGAYLTPMLGCRECHGDDYRGRPTRPNAAPGGPNLLAVAHAQPLEIFQRATREGIAPDGRALDPSKMPWPSYQALTDTEIRSVYEYLKSLPNTPAATP